MIAACLTAPRTIQMREIPPPETPPDGLVLAVRACGVCGSDLRRWREGPPPGVDHIIQGHELAGEVIATGPTQKQFAVGDRLAVCPDVHCGNCYYCRRGLFNLCPHLCFLGITPGWNGGFAEQIALTGKVLQDGIVHRMPPELTFPEGGMAETLSSVLASHHKCATSLGDTVVVMGAGPIGCLHTAVARARGARVIITEPKENRRQIAQRFEPDAILDPDAQDIPGEIFKRTGDVGADIVICANQVAATQTLAVEVTRRAGRIVLFGGLPKATPTVEFNANKVHYGEITIVGAFSYHPSFHEEALKVLARKTVDASLFITHTQPLSQTPEAFQDADSGQALKVMVEPEA